MDTTYEAVGGMEFFQSLVAAFYVNVERDPLLRPLYPPDLTDSAKWMTLFLSQYFGGPGMYSEIKGHPRLRMRHGHLQIGVRERDAWWQAMHDAVIASGVAEPYRGAMLEYFTTAADWMINHDDQTPTET